MMTAAIFSDIGDALKCCALRSISPCDNMAAAVHRTAAVLLPEHLSTCFYVLASDCHLFSIRHTAEQNIHLLLTEVHWRHTTVEGYSVCRSSYSWTEYDSAAGLLN